MKYLRQLLFPFSLLYGLVIIIRNWCYDSGVFKSRKFDKPIISVGNIDVGGAGKSPMTEYLIRLLKDHYKIATLSRGYGRETKGYFVSESGEAKSGERESKSKNQELKAKNQDEEVKTHERKRTQQVLQPKTHNSQPTNAYSPLTTHHSQLTKTIGDEPAQFRQKFPDITVAVCEKRADGIEKLLPNHDLVILDDAYQHRAVEPGLSILMFDYNRINEPRLLLPAGNLREPFSGRWRAQILVISKCPEMLSAEELGELAAMVQPLPYQRLFFTAITYQGLQDLDGKPNASLPDNETTVFLLTGIANPEPLVTYIHTLTRQLIQHNYPDHHPFSLKNISKLATDFAACPSSKKIIVTTEKDAQRLQEPLLRKELQRLPIFAMPIKIKFLNDDGDRFDQLIINYVRNHTAGNGFH